MAVPAVPAVPLPRPIERRAEGLPCPVCKVDLVMSDRQGVEIDYCPKCRGIWLDRGELDKIIEMSLRQSPQSEPSARPVSAGNPTATPDYPPAAEGYRAPSGYGDRDRHSGGHGGGHGDGGSYGGSYGGSHGGGHGGSHGGGHGGSHGGGHGGRRRSWLRDLFD